MRPSDWGKHTLLLETLTCTLAQRNRFTQILWNENRLDIWDCVHAVRVQQVTKMGSCHHPCADSDASVAHFTDSWLTLARLLCVPLCIAVFLASSGQLRADPDDVTISSCLISGSRLTLRQTMVWS